MPHPKPRPPQFRLKVRRSRTGLGLYALEDIPRHRFVIEYVGRLVPDVVADRIGGKYLFDLENGKHILGGERKNIARYANHACKPNSEVRVSKSRVYIWTTKRIRAGEEINYDYGKEYFDEYIKPYGCRCQSCNKS